MSASDIHFFFTMREQIKVYHWQTTSFSRHKATDGALEKLDDLIDTYVEVYIGKYGRPRFNGHNNTVEIQNLNEKAIVPFIHKCIQYITVTLTKSLKSDKDTDLLNLRDEILAELNKLLYLFTLH